MANRKHNRSPSVVSKRSLSSLSDTVIRAGHKAKQKALKTVKSFTALTSHVVLDSDRKLLLLCKTKFDCHLVNTGPTGDGASAMDIEGGTVSSRALSMMDINMPISILSDDEDTEEKIIQKAEDKISLSSTGS